MEAYDQITAIVKVHKRKVAIDALTHALFDLLMENPDKEDIILEVGHVTMAIIGHVKADLVRRGMN